MQAQNILNELSNSMAEANDPNTVWLSHDEIMEKLMQQRVIQAKRAYEKKIKNAAHDIAFIERTLHSQYDFTHIDNERMKRWI